MHALPQSCSNFLLKKRLWNSCRKNSSLLFFVLKTDEKLLFGYNRQTNMFAAVWKTSLTIEAILFHKACRGSKYFRRRFCSRMQRACFKISHLPTPQYFFFFLVQLLDASRLQLNKSYSKQLRVEWLEEAAEMFFLICVYTILFFAKNRVKYLLFSDMEEITCQ